jgi:hypothetical protein
MDAAAEDDVTTPAVAAPAAGAPAAQASAWARARSLAQRPLVSYVIAFALALGFYHHAYGALAKHGMTGDEPSYLLDAFSMARDGDRNLAGQNSHDLIALFGIPAYPHTIHNTSAGDISIHGAGTALDVVPAVWLGDWQGNPIRWVRLELVLIDALTALALFALIRRSALLLGIRLAFAWAAWAATAASLPLVAYSEQLYPEVPALLCILLAINAAIRPRPRWPLVLAGSVAASYLPWLHIRFIPTCFALLAALALRGLSAIAAESRDGPEPARGRIAAWASEARGILRALATRAGALVVGAAVIPAVVSFGLMAIEFQHWYGSPNWTVTAGGGGVPTQITDTWYPMVLGGLFGTDYGWVPWAPVAVLAIAATGCLLLEAPRWTTCALAVLAVYQAELAVSGLATPGFVFPGRYEIICIPLFGVALMVALARVPVTWLAFIPLLAATLAISWQASERPEANLLNTGAVGLPMAAHLTSAFPDVETITPPTSFTADPTILAGTVGRAARNDKVLRSRAADKAGFLAAGPRVPLAPGVYTAHFLIGQTGGRDHVPLAELQVWSIANATPLAAKRISAAELPPGRPKQFDLQFTTPGGLPIETRVYVTGRATVELTGTSAVPVAIAPLPVLDRYPDGSLMAAWVGGTVFVGALLAYAAYLRRRVTGREALRPLS